MPSLFYPIVGFSVLPKPLSSRLSSFPRLDKLGRYSIPELGENGSVIGPLFHTLSGVYRHEDNHATEPVHGFLSRDKHLYLTLAEVKRLRAV